MRPWPRSGFAGSMIAWGSSQADNSAKRYGANTRARPTSAATTEAAHNAYIVSRGAKRSFTGGGFLAATRRPSTRLLSNDDRENHGAFRASAPALEADFIRPAISSDHAMIKANPAPM